MGVQAGSVHEGKSWRSCTEFETAELSVSFGGDREPCDFGERLRPADSFGVGLEKFEFIAENGHRD